MDSERNGSVGAKIQEPIHDGSILFEPQKMQVLCWHMHLTHAERAFNKNITSFKTFRTCIKDS